MSVVFALLVLGIVYFIVIALEVEKEMYSFKKRLFLERKLDKHNLEIKLQIKQKRLSLYKDKTKNMIYVMLFVFCLGISAMAQIALISAVK